VTAVVAVGTGDGIHRIFYSLGASSLVAGGQSMNPSTQDILDAVEATPSEEVVVLPNNSNIFPVARQAAEIASKKVFVVPTPGVQEGFAALLEYDPSSPGADNARLMEEAARRIVAGEVTRAVRRTTCAAGDVAVGDYIGLSRSGIESVGKGLADATIGLLAALLVPGHEIVTLVQGEGSTTAETRAVTEWLSAVHPEVTVELHHGGQPLYPYLVSIE
jgi:dihydroxyacetone kinase-like predicted kinase